MQEAPAGVRSETMVSMPLRAAWPLLLLASWAPRAASQCDEWCNEWTADQDECVQCGGVESYDADPLLKYHDDIPTHVDGLEDVPPSPPGVTLPPLFEANTVCNTWCSESTCDNDGCNGELFCSHTTTPHTHDLSCARPHAPSTAHRTLY